MPSAKRQMKRKNGDDSQGKAENGRNVKRRTRSSNNADEQEEIFSQKEVSMLSDAETQPQCHGSLSLDSHNVEDDSAHSVTILSHQNDTNDCQDTEAAHPCCEECNDTNEIEVCNSIESSKVQEETVNMKGISGKESKKMQVFEEKILKDEVNSLSILQPVEYEVKSLFSDQSDKETQEADLGNMMDFENLTGVQDKIEEKKTCQNDSNKRSDSDIDHSKDSVGTEEEEEEVNSLSILHDLVETENIYDHCEMEKIKKSDNRQLEMSDNKECGRISIECFNGELVQRTDSTITVKKFQEVKNYFALPDVDELSSSQMKLGSQTSRFKPPFKSSQIQNKPQFNSTNKSENDLFERYDTNEENVFLPSKINNEDKNISLMDKKSNNDIDPKCDILQNNKVESLSITMQNITAVENNNKMMTEPSSNSDAIKSILNPVAAVDEHISELHEVKSVVEEMKGNEVQNTNYVDKENYVNTGKEKVILNHLVESNNPGYGTHYDNRQFNMFEGPSFPINSDINTIQTSFSSKCSSGERTNFSPVTNEAKTKHTMVSSNESCERYIPSVDDQTSYSSSSDIVLKKDKSEMGNIKNVKDIDISCTQGFIVPFPGENKSPTQTTNKTLELSQQSGSSLSPSQREEHSDICTQNFNNTNTIVEINFQDSNNHSIFCGVDVKVSENKENIRPEDINDDMITKVNEEKSSENMAPLTLDIAEEVKPTNKQFPIQCVTNDFQDIPSCNNAIDFNVLRLVNGNIKKDDIILNNIPELKMDYEVKTNDINLKYNGEQKLMNSFMENVNDDKIQNTNQAKLTNTTSSKTDEWLFDIFHTPTEVAAEINSPNYKAVDMFQQIKTPLTIATTDFEHKQSKKIVQPAIAETNVNKAFKLNTTCSPMEDDEIDMVMMMMTDSQMGNQRQQQHSNSMNSINTTKISATTTTTTTTSFGQTTRHVNSVLTPNYLDNFDNKGEINNNQSSLNQLKCEENKTKKQEKNIKNAGLIMDKKREEGNKLIKVVLNDLVQMNRQIIKLKKEMESIRRKLPVQGSGVAKISNRNPSHPPLPALHYQRPQNPQNKQ